MASRTVPDAKAPPSDVSSSGVAEFSGDDLVVQSVETVAGGFGAFEVCFEGHEVVVDLVGKRERG